MATYLPPSENLPIFDTSVFDETNGAYLTYTSAKKLFLTYPTAQGEETIASLIAGSIDYTSPASGSYFDIGTNQVSGGTIRLGPTGTSGVSVHAGNIDCTNNTINNATDAALNNLSLGNSQTTGILNIGTGTRTTGGNGGAINIGTGGSITAPINIGGGASSSNTINIGQTGSTTGTTTTNINTSSSGAHPVNIGSSTALTTINGTLTTSLGTIAGKNANLEYLVTSLPAALDLTTSNLNIFINFFGGTPSGSFTIPSTTTAGQQITLKNSSSGTLTIAFTTLLLSLFGDSGVGVSSTTISSGNSLTFIYSTTPSRWFQIGTSNNFPTGLTCSTITASGTITADGGITLPSGDTLTVTGTISGTGAISTSGNISTSGSGTITSAGLLTASGGLTISGNNNITLGTPTTAPILGQLGYINNVLTGGVSYSLATANVATQLTSFSMPVGTFIVYWSAVCLSNATYYTMGINTSTAQLTTMPKYVGCVLATTNGNVTNPKINMSGIVQNTATTTWYLNHSATVAGTNYVTDVYLYYVRIA